VRINVNLAVFLSGTGTNFTAIAEAANEGGIPVIITLVAGNKPDAAGLQKARYMNIPTALFMRPDFPDGKSFADYMLSVLRKYDVDLIALAGYMRKIPPRVIRAYRNRIVNIHPALLPRFGGKGMYGMTVHRAVIEAGVTETGVTVHYVDEEYDRGEIIEQRLVPVQPDDTPETLAARVLKVEHELYPEVLGKLAENLK